jgi:riboflavin biosynthesis pyrimidine reductase
VPRSARLVRGAALCEITDNGAPALRVALWQERRLPAALRSGPVIRCRHLREGLLDEIVIHLAPVLLGQGVRLYDSIGADPIVLTRTAVAAAGQITDLRFRV